MTKTKKQFEMARDNILKRIKKTIPTGKGRFRIVGTITTREKIKILIFDKETGKIKEQIFKLK